MTMVMNPPRMIPAVTYPDVHTEILDITKAGKEFKEITMSTRVRRIDTNGKYRYVKHNETHICPKEEFDEHLPFAIQSFHQIIYVSDKLESIDNIDIKDPVHGNPLYPICETQESEYKRLKKLFQL